jgi:hypothetical protein
LSVNLSDILTNILAALAVSGGSLFLIACRNGLQALRLRKYISGVFHYYWIVSPKAGTVGHGTFTIRYRAVGRLIPFCPFHNIVITAESPDISIKIDWEARLVSSNRFYEFSMFDSVNMNASLCYIAKPEYMNVNILSGLVTFIAIAGNPMSNLFVLTREPMTDETIISLIGKGSSILLRDAEFVKQVSHTTSARHDLPTE